MVNIVEFVQESSLSPSQWIGLTSEGKGVYIRYRWNTLTVRVGNQPVKGDIIYKKEHSQNNLTTNELIQILSSVENINISKENHISLANISKELTEIRNEM